MTDKADTKRNASIVGAGKLAGGTYGHVSITGAGTVEGDLEVEEIEVTGPSSLHGSVKARKLRTAGACSTDGDVETRILSSSGSIKINGRVLEGSIDFAGGTKVGGNLKTEEVTIGGSFRTGGDVEAERFEVDGSFRVPGLLNADEIDVELDGRSTAQKIGCSRITVRRKRGHLEVQYIEGDEIYLEATEAQTIRGKRVKLGDSCRVDTVEYTESLDVSPEATVGNQVRTGGDDQPSV